MPERSRQIIIFVSDSQWSKEVAGEMREIAGRQYRLEYTDADEGEGYETTDITRELEEAAA